MPSDRRRTRRREPRTAWPATLCRGRVGQTRDRVAFRRVARRPKRGCRKSRRGSGRARCGNDRWIRDRCVRRRSTSPCAGADSPARPRVGNPLGTSRSSTLTSHKLSCTRPAASGCGFRQHACRVAADCSPSHAERLSLGDGARHQGDACSYGAGRSAADSHHSAGDGDGDDDGVESARDLADGHSTGTTVRCSDAIVDNHSAARLLRPLRADLRDPLKRSLRRFGAARVSGSAAAGLALASGRAAELSAPSQGAPQRGRVPRRARPQTVDAARARRQATTRPRR